MAYATTTPPARHSRTLQHPEEFVLYSADSPTFAIYSSRVPVIDIDTGVVLNAPRLSPEISRQREIQRDSFLPQYFPLWQRAQQNGDDAIRLFYDRITHAVLKVYGYAAPFSRAISEQSPSLTSARNPPPPPAEMTKGEAMDIICETRWSIQCWFTNYNREMLCSPPAGPRSLPSRATRSPSISSRLDMPAAPRARLRRVRKRNNSARVNGDGEQSCGHASVTVGGESA